MSGMAVVSGTKRMTCAEAGRRLQDYLDHTLPPGEAQGVAEHVETCVVCLELWRQMRCTRRLLRRSARLEPMPAPMKRTLIAEFLARFPAAPSHRSRTTALLRQQTNADMS